jgi:AIR synthase-related protein
MKLPPHSLDLLISALRDAPGLRSKRDIHPAASSFGKNNANILNGDDAAALPDPDGGYTLLAAEGMQPSFVQREPYFAGLCAVLCNVNDIAAMGGRSRALVDVLLTGSDREHTELLHQGLKAGSELFQVPIVGGHSGKSAGAPCLSAAVLGKAQRLITSFDARPGQVLMVCIDLGGRFRTGQPHFDGLTGGDPKLARARLEVLPQLAEAGWVGAGKDISMAGLLGTLLMLLETSDCGARVDLEAVPAPACALAEPQRWLASFPSFGFVLSVEPEYVELVRARFAQVAVTAAAIGTVEATRTLDIAYGSERARFWDLSHEPLMGFGG